jgi:hypothetical protein
MVPLEKSKTSSESKRKMLSAFSHLFTLSPALLQISGMKSCHELLHSSLTIEMSVEFILVRRAAALGYPAIWSGVLKTS